MLVLVCVCYLSVVLFIKMYRKSFLLILDQKELSGDCVSENEKFPAPRQMESFDSMAELVTHTLSPLRDRDCDLMQWLEAGSGLQPLQKKERERSIPAAWDPHPMHPDRNDRHTVLTSNMNVPLTGPLVLSPAIAWVHAAWHLFHPTVSLCLDGNI